MIAEHSATSQGSIGFIGLSDVGSLANSHAWSSQCSLGVFRGKICGMVPALQACVIEPGGPCRGRTYGPLMKSQRRSVLSQPG
jgi:hypothetical protein